MTYDLLILIQKTSCKLHVSQTTVIRNGIFKFLFMRYLFKTMKSLVQATSCSLKDISNAEQKAYIAFFDLLYKKVYAYLLTKGETVSNFLAADKSRLKSPLRAENVS